MPAGLAPAGFAQRVLVRRNRRDSAFVPWNGAPMTKWFKKILPAVGFAMVLHAQDAVFRSDVTLVRVDAEVADGVRLVEGLTKDDFVILDNDAPQPISALSRDEAPLDVMALLDVSASMWPVLQRVSDSARAAFDQLHAGDRIGVAAFAVRGRILQPLTDNRDEAERALGDFRNTGLGAGTRIITGLNTVAKYLLSEPRQERRRAVLLITDNVGTRSVREGPVVRAFWEADAVVTGLEVSDPMARVARVIKWASPTAIAISQGADGVIRKTGGEMEKTGDAGTAFGEALHRLRTRYSIYYAPPAGKAGEEHRVKVTLSAAAAKAHPGARVHARAGYVMPAPRQ